MSISKLWNRLFTKNTEPDEIALHVSGATVRHRNPFENIEVQRNDRDIEERVIEKWVDPFYTNFLSNVDEVTITAFADAAREINISVVRELLGDFNWRTRITGSFFSAINNYHELLDTIGKHLLKSEVCYAGSGYCLALATFGGEEAKRFLTSYLDYYLERPDLWFDQGDAFCALEYLDKALSDQRHFKWNEYVADKPHWDLNRSRETFRNSMATIDKIRTAKTHLP